MSAAGRGRDPLRLSGGRAEGKRLASQGLYGTVAVAGRTRLPCRSPSGTVVAAGRLRRDGETRQPLQITSIHADAAGNDNDNLNDEYVVCKVLVAGSLVGYFVEDDANHTYYFPDRVFQAGQTFTLRTGSGADDQTHLYWGSGSAIWNNDGDTVKVLDPEGHVVVSKGY